MSITAPDDRITTYQPVVATTSFAADFPVFDDDDIAVYLNGVLQNGFVVSATYVNGVSNDAQAIFSVGITGLVQVVGSREPKRTNRFQTGGPLPIPTINLALDTLEAEMQEVAREANRAHRAPLGVEGGVFSAADIANAQGYAETAKNEADRAEDAAEEAVDARDAAADYASLARNDFVWKDFTGDGVTTAFDLGVDPGSANNVFAFVEGIRQTNISLAGTVVTFDAAPPAPSPGGKSKNIEFSFGFRTTVGTPADGSITNPKLGAGAVTPDKMAQVLGARNAVLNPRFLCNTRAVSGTVTLAAGVRGHDCWKAGAAGCTYTFTKTGNRVVLTITAGSLQQVVPGDDLESGNYFLSWAGTAQGRINGGAYGVSGAVSAAITAGTNATIEFNTGTLSYPQFELGYVTKFDLQPTADERKRVERYVRSILFVASGYKAAAAKDFYNVVNFDTMAAIPAETKGTKTLINCSDLASTIAANAYTCGGLSTAAGDVYVSYAVLLTCEL